MRGGLDLRGFNRLRYYTYLISAVQELKEAVTFTVQKSTALASEKEEVQQQEVSQIRTINPTKERGKRNARHIEHESG